MLDEQDALQIGEFAELVGLSVPQLRRYDRLQLLAPAGRSEAGYRYYSRGQTGAARVIALLRSVDMPLADIRRILGGAGEEERRAVLQNHRFRLEERLEEVRSLLEAVDAMTEEDTTTAGAQTQLSSWLHLMPRLPVSDLDCSIAFYQEALGFRVAWRTADGGLAALTSGDIEVLLLVTWTGDAPPPPQSAYVYVGTPTRCVPSTNRPAQTSSSRSHLGRTACATSSSRTRMATASGSGVARSGYAM